MAKTRLTQRRIAALRPRETTIDIRDAGLKGFGVRVYPTGLRRYFIHAQAEGTRIWKVVGDADDMNVDDARTQARVMLAELKGRVPTAPQAPLFEAVAEEVFRRYARNWKPRTLEVNRGYYGKQILPWFRGRPIVGITSQDIRAWFASLHRIPVAADRSLPVLSVIMTQAEIYGYRPEGSNPCHGIRRYRRKGRERFLSEEEVRRLGEVLARHEGDHPMCVAIIRLLLLTGCRKREIATLRWKEYREGHLHLADSKTGPRMVWLSSPARLILEEQPRISTWVFPSTRTRMSVGRSMVDAFWMRLRSEAGLQDVRLHDLRHSFASIAIMTGENVLTVGRLLGHNDPGTTLKYTHITSDAAVHAAQKLGPVLGGSAA
ncbi:MAG: tyrosine-type recombinase/integrase [bacterium]|nr:tyrosine-type recombinase/integrase [bacterium]